MLRQLKVTPDVAFPDPRWLNEVSGITMSENQTFVVEDDGRIVLHGVPLRFVGGQGFPSGTDVVLSTGRWFWAALKGDYLAHVKALDEEAERVAAARGAKAQKYHADARELNSRILPGAVWSIGHKPVLSGLTENSHGDGARRNSVFHVLLDQAWSSGRISRKAGEFLCTRDAGSFGSDPEFARLGAKDGSNAQPVTCKACLKIAARISAAAPEIETQGARAWLM